MICKLSFLSGCFFCLLLHSLQLLLVQPSRLNRPQLLNLKGIYYYAAVSEEGWCRVFITERHCDASGLKEHSGSSPAWILVLVWYLFHHLLLAVITELERLVPNVAIVTGVPQLDWLLSDFVTPPSSQPPP